jgi:hypothetical protein
MPENFNVVIHLKSIDILAVEKETVNRNCMDFYTEKDGGNRKKKEFP